MEREQTLFRAGWFTAGHGKLWNCDSTYCFVPYETLPSLPLEMFSGEFQWLTKLDNKLRQEIELYRLLEERSQIPDHLNYLVESARRLNLELPPSFVKFMNTLDLQDRVPSCTACYFDLPDQIIESPFGDGGYLIRFLDDQQWNLLWYLYLRPDGEHCVLVSSFAFDKDIDYIDGSLETNQRETFFCAPAFEVFLYRFWIENLLWYTLSNKQDLTEAQQAYLKARRIN